MECLIKPNSESYKINFEVCKMGGGPRVKPKVEYECLENHWMGDKMRVGQVSATFEIMPYRWDGLACCSCDR